MSATALAASVVLPAAGAGRVAWTKAWAQQLLARTYNAVTTVCLPIGPAIRRVDETEFREFICSLVTADGTRYTIRLKPRTHTTWKTISLKRDRPAAAAAPGKPPKEHPQHEH